MSSPLPKHLKKKLQKLHLSRQTCSIQHCTHSASNRWESAPVCDVHYKQCWNRYLQGWIMFIAQITQEVMVKMMLSRDERCILDPASCFKGPNFDSTVAAISNYIMDNYIPSWASGVVTKTLVVKGVTQGLLPKLRR